MGSDDEDDQQTNTSKNVNNSFSNTVFSPKKQNTISVEEINIVSETDNSDECNSVESETKPQKRKKRNRSETEKHMQSMSDEGVSELQSKSPKFKCIKNVNKNPFVEIEDPSDATCLNPIKNSKREIIDISENKSSKLVRELNTVCSSDKMDNDIEILNDSECSLPIQSTRKKSSDFSKNIDSEMKSLKKKRKQAVKSEQVLECNEEGGLQKLNLLNVEDSQINSRSFIEDTTQIMKKENLEPKSAKGQKTKHKEQTQISADLENAEAMDWETVKEDKEKAKSANQEKQNMENSEGAFHTIGQVQYQKDIKCRQTLPDWLKNPIYINMQEEKVPICELNNLDTVFKDNLAEIGIECLFPVQSAVLPLLMKNYVSPLRVRVTPSDICLCAPTGSGKTFAFVLPIVQALIETSIVAIRALVVLPVSELAIQVYKVFKSVTRGTRLQVLLLTGQKSFLDEQKKLIRFKSTKKALSLVDIIVTTPGRLRDHIYRTDGFCLKFLRYLVIDEADRMMDEIQQGLLKQIEDAVFKDCHSANCVCSGRPTKRKRSIDRTSAFDLMQINEPLQKLLCSATLTRDPEQLHTLSLFMPKLFTPLTSNSEHKFLTDSIIPDKLTTLQVICVEGIKPMIICHLIKQQRFQKVLCFTESVERTHKLNLLLEAMGLQVREISSDKKAVQRKIVLKQFAAGRINVLVCSDLITRGIDIENVDCVISYDVPQCDKMYVHRIGRTARAGKSGVAITLLSEGEIPHFKKILSSSGLQIPDSINIQSEDLKPLLKSYRAALSTVNNKLKSKYISQISFCSFYIKVRA